MVKVPVGSHLLNANAMKYREPTRRLSTYQHGLKALARAPLSLFDPHRTPRRTSNCSAPYLTASAWHPRERRRRRRRWRSGGDPAVGQREADADGGHGHGVVPRGARGRQGRRAGGHRGGVPPLRHGFPVRHREAARRRRGLLRSREELFVTSKLWCSQTHADLVLPSLRETLENLQMEYVDLYLIHWPVCLRPAAGPPKFPNRKEDAVPLDVAGVWRAMEECQRLGLARAIGVSNFTTRHLDKVLAVAAVPPAVNQVELNPAWQQRTLRAYCADRGVHVAAYSPLGGQNWDGRGNAVLDSEVLAEIARARGKTVAQVALRWIHEQGVTCIVKSYNRERLKQNLEIFDWELTDDDRLKISHIPQRKVVEASGLFSQEGEFTSVDPAELNIVEE